MSTIFDRYSVSYSGGSAPASSESAMVLPHRTAELLEADEAQSFVHKLQLSVSKGLPHAVPVPGLRTEEHELVGIQLLSNMNMILIPSGTSSS